MSSEKRTPISIYLTPRASMVLREYNQGSGYGSASRTVEEIILAFDTVYNSMRSYTQLSKMAPKNPRKQQEQAATALIAFIALLQSISDATARLHKESATNLLPT